MWLIIWNCEIPKQNVINYQIVKLLISRLTQLHLSFKWLCYLVRFLRFLFNLGYFCELSSGISNIFKWKQNQKFITLARDSILWAKLLAPSLQSEVYNLCMFNLYWRLCMLKHLFCIQSLFGIELLMGFYILSAYYILLMSQLHESYHLGCSVLVKPWRMYWKIYRCPHVWIQWMLNPLWLWRFACGDSRQFIVVNPGDYSLRKSWPPVC